MSIRLVIVDDHDLMRDGLRMTFEGTEVVIVAEAADGQQGLEALLTHSPNVALVDISMPVADGFYLLRNVQTSNIPVPILMHSMHDGHARRCRELGAKGFVLKGQEKDVLLAAVRAVHAGQEYWSLGNA